MGGADEKRHVHYCSRDVIDRRIFCLIQSKGADDWAMTLPFTVTRTVAPASAIEIGWSRSRNSRFLWHHRPSFITDSLVRLRAWIRHPRECWRP